MKNKYIKFAHISETKTREIIRLNLDVEAEKTAELTGVSRQTINRIYKTIQERVRHLTQSYKRNRELLRTVQSEAGEVLWHPQAHLSPAHQGVRVQVQLQGQEFILNFAQKL